MRAFHLVMLTNRAITRWSASNTKCVQMIAWSIPFRWCCICGVKMHPQMHVKRLGGSSNIRAVCCCLFRVSKSFIKQCEGNSFLFLFFCSSIVCKLPTTSNCWTTSHSHVPLSLPLRRTFNFPSVYFPVDQSYRYLFAISLGMRGKLPIVERREENNTFLSCP